MGAGAEQEAVGVTSHNTNADLFADLLEDGQPTDHAEEPWTAEHAMRTFLNRWHWRGDREGVEGELRELLAEWSKR